MEYIRGTLDFSNIIKSGNPGTAITFGKFDGLHRGHELLMGELFKVAAERQLLTIAFTFDIPPVSKTGEKISMPQVITTNAEKRCIFEKTGIDYLVECPFTSEVMGMSPEKFIDWVVTAFSVKSIVVGTDFCFGHNRSGDYRTLDKFSEKYGYGLTVVDKVQEDGRDISSTFVRDEIKRGNIQKANGLLGYEFFIMGRVVHGRRLGHKIGIPTVNMDVPAEKLLPPNGVYATRVHIGENTYMGVTNVGTKPTVSENGPMCVETHVIELDITDELYGQEITVEFLRFIRQEKKFDSVEELREQMERDIRDA
ncbi:MAG: bifunctional riboflavin kinase/FAD synthetase, partial [Clostridiales bacterium]|nr:bifunctional riboflavin kinase/FAD synthetase [Clostridiales bacterium]